MDDTITELDDIRYQHHLMYRGKRNERLVQLLWLAVAAVLSARAAWRASSFVSRRWRKYRPLTSRQSLGRGLLNRISAFFQAGFLLSFPGFPLSPKSSLSLGQGLSLIAYISIIAFLMVSVDAPSASQHFVDDVAFRAAWVTLAQVPLVYLLSTKRGPLYVFAGLSYDRVNWVHRWVGQVLFLSGTAHMSIMVGSISIKQIVKSTDQASLMVRHGAAAYGILAWIALTSVLPIRRWCYGLFYMNHRISMLAFIWMLALHIPSNARLAAYLSMVCITVDQCLSWYAFLFNNVTMRPVKRSSQLSDGLAMGHSVKMRTPYITNSSFSLTETTTVIRICDVGFSWRPGQHVRLYIPRFGAIEAHPFTPATCSEMGKSPFALSRLTNEENSGFPQHQARAPANDLVLMIRSHSRFTKRLAEYHTEWLSLPCPNASQMSSSLTAYIDGPFGSPPPWEDYEHLVLVATSTGVSFSLSIMGYLEQLCVEDQTRLRTHKIQFIWAVRHLEPQFEATVVDMLMKHSTVLRESGIRLKAEFYVSCPYSRSAERKPETREHDPFAHLRQPQSSHFFHRPPLTIRHPNSIDRERQMGLEMINPFADEVESQSDYESDASSTLVDEEEALVYEEEELVYDEEELVYNSDEEPESDDMGRSLWNRMPHLSFRQSSSPTEECQCAFVQFERLSSKPIPSQSFITRIFDCRPNMKSLLSSSIPKKSRNRSMVAVCSNQSLARNARNTVARMNLDFALRRREGGVDIFTEGFV